MHTAPDPRTDRIEDRRTSARARAERFSPDEHEGFRERRSGSPIDIPVDGGTRTERVNARSDANAPILTP